MESVGRGDTVGVDVQLCRETGQGDEMQSVKDDAGDQAPWPRNRDGSGQGVLLVILGEFVWRSMPYVWSSTLIAALDAIGISESATRKAIFRADQTGLIALERHGRRKRCSLTEKADAMFDDGNRRVFGFEGERLDWDRRWLVVTASVPESQRRLRHYLKSRFAWRGMGSPAPGIWITPHTDTPIGRILEQAGSETAFASFIGSFGPVGLESDMVRAAWDIPQLETRYRNFVAHFEKLAPAAGAESFSAYVQLIQAWRAFPFLDPRLPSRFLPQPWIGRSAAAFLRDRRKIWKLAAQDFWTELCDSNLP